jgi:hypothetical protein
VHWLRVILDEGHAIGTLATTNKLLLANHLRADRRWVMTGAHPSARLVISRHLPLHFAAPWQNWQKTPHQACRA